MPLRFPHRACAASLLALAGAASAGPPLDPPRQYVVHGQGALTVDGPRCCGDARLHAEFRAAFQVESSGRATLAGLDLDVADIDLSFPGFLGLFAHTVPLRCAALGLAAPAEGWSDGAGGLAFAPGKLALRGQAAHARHADGACDAAELMLAGANDTTLTAGHDPWLDRFTLDATFPVVIEGETHALTLRAQGRYTNRPPYAWLDVLTPASPQGGCPAFWYLDGQTWELAAEANHPTGLVAGLRANAWDPDTAWSEGGAVAVRFFHTRGAGATKLIGDQHQLGPLAFEFGPRHRVELLATDGDGASAAAECSFRVVDTRAPEVGAPAPVSVACAQDGGASAATSPELAAFLAGGSAVDAVDPAPARLAAQSGGVPVDDATLFPLGGPHDVVFRFRDAWGNEGSAESSVTVSDDTPPSATVSAAPAWLAAGYEFWWISVSLEAVDACGGPVSAALESITSNAPEFDAGDVLDAAWGSDDRGFYLFTRPAGAGLPRLYKVTYRVTDARGNVTRVAAQVQVG